MNTVFNEYLTPASETTLLLFGHDKKVYCVRYDPLDAYRDAPEDAEIELSDLEGTINTPNKPKSPFRLNGEVLDFFNSNKNTHIRGGFINSDGSIRIHWRIKPPPHFLCVNYRYRLTYLAPAKVNWKLEGF
jgi:hypothetical protein